MTTRKSLDLDFELVHDEDSCDEMAYMSPSGDHVIIGYLSPDSDGSGDPFDGDGMGEIIHEADDFPAVREHLGYTSEGRPNIGLQTELVMRLLGFSNCDFDDLNGEDVERVEVAATHLWDAAKLKGKVGTPYVQGLHIYNGFISQADDISRVNAVWIPDSCWLECINDRPEQERSAWYEKDLKSTLDTYEDYLQGNVYGVCVEHYKQQPDGTYELLDEDACWGYVGHKYALESVTDDFECAVAHHIECNPDLLAA